jgi:hypothetical protein
VAGQPRQIFSGDTIKIGTETRIRVEIGQPAKANLASVAPSNVQTPPANSAQPTPNSAPKPIHTPPAHNSNSVVPPVLIFAAFGSVLLIAFLGIAAYLLVDRYDTGASNSKIKPTTKIAASAAIPIRVVDPLGGGELDDLEELIEAWEVQDAAFEAKDLQAVSVSTDAPQLSVPLPIGKKRALWRWASATRRPAWSAAFRFRPNCRAISANNWRSFKKWV